MEQGDNVRQEIRPDRRWHAEAQHALERFISRRGEKADFTYLGENAPPNLGNLRANRGEQSAGTISLHELGAEPVLKCFDLLAERGLRGVASL